jgi:hypothetical protein
MVKPVTPRRKNRKRPIAGTIIVLLTLAEILLRLYWVVHYVLVNKVWQQGLPAPLWLASAPTPAGLEFATSAFRLLWLLIGTGVLLGLLRMKRWSWVMLVFWASVSLSVGILHFFYRSWSAFTASDYAVMAADMILVFALNQAEIQRLYGIRRDDVEQLS